MMDWLAMTNQTLLEKERGRVRALSSQVEELRAAKEHAEQQVRHARAGRQGSAKWLAGCLVGQGLPCLLSVLPCLSSIFAV